MNKDERTKKMMSEEYCRDITGCFTGIVIATLITIGIGVISCLAAL